MTEQPTSPPAEPLTSTEPFVSNRPRATVTVILLLTLAALGLVSILSSLLQLSLASEAIAGEVISDERAAANDLRQAAVAILLLIVNIATVVAFCFWIHRAYRNLRALGNPPNSLDFSPGWAVGWFFIPIANIIMPYRVVRELWAKSDPSVRTKDDFLFAAEASTALIPVWWVMWLVSNFVERLVNRFYGDAETAEGLAWATKADIVSTVLWIVAALLAALVVRRIDGRQEERSRHVVYQPETPPPPPIFTPPQPAPPPVG